MAQKKLGFTVNSNVQGDSLIINNGLTASVQYKYEGSSDLVFQLPLQDGISGQALKTDGAGNLSFGTVSTNSTSGSSGSSGTSGESGTAGTSGTSGSTGSSGTSGFTYDVQSISHFTGATISGTVSVVAASASIPANTFGTGQHLQLTFSFIRKLPATGTATISVYINTTPDLSGSPKMLATMISNSTSASWNVIRNIYIGTADGTGTGTFVNYFNTAVQTDIFGASTAAQTAILNIDWTQQQYLVASISQTSATDQTRIYGISLSSKQGIRGSAGSSGSSGTSGVSGATGATGSVTAYTFNAYVTDSTTINLLLNNSNWSSGKYVGTALSNTYQGQKFYSATMSYIYEAVADNSWVRIALS